VGLPPITTPITLLGVGTSITRDRGQFSTAGVTIRGGSALAPQPGVGISNLGGALSLISSSVTGNTAVADGGIYTDNGAVSLTANMVSGKTPDSGAPSGSVPGCA